jgi:hypothetical protein
MEISSLKFFAGFTKGVKIFIAALQPAFKAEAHIFYVQYNFLDCAT